MTATATQVKKATSGLVRGASVIVGDTYSDESVQGQTVVIASKGTVPCNKKGKCADESKCVGKALFVNDPNYGGDRSPTAWRTGTLKICLTHLQTEHGAAVLPPKRTPKKRSKEEPSFSAAFTPEALPPTAGHLVTWEQLAEAHQSRNPEALALYARKLKAENEMLVRRLIEAQGKVIAALESR